MLNITTVKKAITVRRKINQLLRIPFKFQNYKIPVRVSEYHTPKGTYLNANNEVVEVEAKTIVRESKANIATRIETYKNKQVVKVYVDVEPRMQRPI